MPEGYPDGLLDEARSEVRFAWEDAYSVYIAAVPMDWRATTDDGRRATADGQRATRF